MQHSVKPFDCQTTYSTHYYTTVIHRLTTLSPQTPCSLPTDARDRHWSGRPTPCVGGPVIMSSSPLFVMQVKVCYNAYIALSPTTSFSPPNYEVMTLLQGHSWPYCKVTTQLRGHDWEEEDEPLHLRLSIHHQVHAPIIHALLGQREMLYFSGVIITKYVRVVGDGRTISTHADPMSTRRAILHERCISSMKFTSVRIYANFYIGVADSSHFGLLGNKVLQNGRFPAHDASEPLCKMWRR